MDYLDNSGTQRLGDSLKDAIKDDAKLSIIASYFTVFAYGELKEELFKVEELWFIFDEPTFAKQMESEKIPREWVLSRRSREKGVGGTGLELTLRNNLNQRALARECAEWARQRATFKSARQRGMIATSGSYHVANPTAEDQAFMGSTANAFRGSLPRRTQATPTSWMPWRSDDCSRTTSGYTCRPSLGT